MVSRAHMGQGARCERAASSEGRLLQRKRSSSVLGKSNRPGGGNNAGELKPAPFEWTSELVVACCFAPCSISRPNLLPSIACLFTLVSCDSARSIGRCTFASKAPSPSGTLLARSTSASCISPGSQSQVHQRVGNGSAPGAGTQCFVLGADKAD